MSIENVEIVRGTVDAYRSGDIDAALAAYDPEVEFDVSSARPEGGVFRGREGVEEGIQAWVGRWAEYRFEVEDIIDAGDRVLMIIQEFGRGEGSGVEVNQHTFWVQTMRGGKIVHTRLFVDREQALEGRRAVGVGGAPFGVVPSSPVLCAAQKRRASRSARYCAGDVGGERGDCPRSGCGLQPWGLGCMAGVRCGRHRPDRGGRGCTRRPRPDSRQGRGALLPG